AEGVDEPGNVWVSLNYTLGQSNCFIQVSLAGNRIQPGQVVGCDNCVLVLGQGFLVVVLGGGVVLTTVFEDPDPRVSSGVVGATLQDLLILADSAIFLLRVDVERSKRGVGSKVVRIQLKCFDQLSLGPLTVVLNPIDLRFEIVQRRIVRIGAQRLVNSGVGLVQFLASCVDSDETVERGEIRGVELQRRFKETNRILGFLLVQRGQGQVVVNTRITRCDVARSLE